jgi:ATP-dependent RNA helicase DDX31/DBP7
MKTSWDIPFFYCYPQEPVAMADDGMLLNFEIGTGPLAQKVLFRGGRWKDRLSAKKFVRRQEGRKLGESKTSTGDIPNEKNQDIGREGSIRSSATGRPAKRQRVSDDPRPTSRRNATASVISGNLPSESISTGRDKDRPGGKLQQIISSLFTFNPSSKTTFDGAKEATKLTKPSNAPLSDEFSTFTNLGMSRRLAAHLATKLQMKAPTAIQKTAIPQLIADDSDAFIQAETGSGKTLAYLLPIVERIMAMSLKEGLDGMVVASKGNQIHRNSGLFAIVLAPTRELCKQISLVLDKLLRCAPWIVGTTVIGGESKKSEKARLRKGVNIMIATPGRLADHLDNTKALAVGKVRWLVLDEGDRLMELGFEEEIKSIVEKIRKRALDIDPSHAGGKDPLPTRRVTILCSATMKMTVQKLGEISLKDAVHIKAEMTKDTTERAAEIPPKDVPFSAPAQLQQACAVVPAKLRLVTLTAVLKRAFARRGSVMKAIVFISCADSVDFHFSLFSRLATAATKDLPPAPIVIKTELTKDTIALATAFSGTGNPVILYKLHGSLPQSTRTATLKAFTDSKDPGVLVCTDVASRGLDLPNIDYVIEYDPPFSADDHLHRIGRTARAGRPGRSLIFLLPGTEEDYISILSSTSSSLTPHTANELLMKGFGGVGYDWEDRATEWQLEVERWALESPKYLEMARRGFQSHIRAYATHVAAERHIFNMQELHLGHLAKAFALRDKPGSIKVPGLRPKAMTRADRSVEERKKRREMKGRAGGTVGLSEAEDRAPEGERARKARKEAMDKPRAENVDDAAKRMKRKMMEHMSSAAEFNIG